MSVWEKTAVPITLTLTDFPNNNTTIIVKENELFMNMPNMSAIVSPFGLDDIAVRGNVAAVFD